MRFRSFLAILLFFSALWSCIPIEDRLSPIMNGLNLRSFYYLQDTVGLSLTLLDNNGLEYVEVFVQKTTNAGTNWEFQDSIPLQGRRFELNYSQVIVPMEATQGFYVMRLVTHDLGGNTASLQETFEVRGDIRGPSLDGLEINNMIELEANRYLGCRLQSVLLSGRVSDPNGLNRITAQFENYPPIGVNLNGVDSVRLEDVFGTRVRIPDDVPDYTTLPLTITAEDGEGNRNTKTVEIYVDCDDQAPQVFVPQTTPLVEQGQVSVVQGASLFLNRVLVTDNRFLERFYVLYGEELVAPDTLFNFQPQFAYPNPNDTFNIVTNYGRLEVPVASDAIAGTPYDLTLVAEDSTGLASTPFRIKITVARDEPPIILVTDTYLNGQEARFSTSASTVVLPGDEVRFEGKIEEDVSFEYIQVYFGRSGNEQLQVELTAVDLANDLPFNLADGRFLNAFDIPEVAASGQTYVVRFVAKDRKNDEVEAEYRFLID